MLVETPPCCSTTAAAASVTDCATWFDASADWPALVFEAGQGLALDEFNAADAPHLTPSRTTSHVSAERIAALPGRTDTEILYVTRSYLTRHGAGPLPTECPMADINPAIVQRTKLSISGVFQPHSGHPLPPQERERTDPSVAVRVLLQE